MKKILRITLLTIVLIMVASIGGFMIWAYTPLGPSDEAILALQTVEKINVIKGDDYYLFQPADVQPETGFIFYPGGRVDYRSYAPVLREIAAGGYSCYLVRLPLNLAVFAPDKAETILTGDQSIENWAIGGHSLGGAMAANFLFTHPIEIDGLILYAAYPANNQNLAQYDVSVLSIYSSEDGLATGEKTDLSRALLPADTVWMEIHGGNHAQFGYYGVQPGDGLAKISIQEQQEIIAQATIDFLSALDENKD